MDFHDMNTYILIFNWLISSSLLSFHSINEQLMRNCSYIFLQYLQYTNSLISSLYVENLHSSAFRSPRSIWMKTRSEAVWLEMWENATDQEWISDFRMTREVFDMIRHKLQPQLSFLVPRLPISPEKQLAITLYYLASCCEYRVVGRIFGVHKTSVWRCIHRVVNAINDVLLPQWIRMPNEAECVDIAAAFEEKTNIPQIIGCIDGSHIPMTPPSDGFRDYVNRKGWPSMVLQGVVDHKLLFRNINIQAPGCCHDAAVFRNSQLFAAHEQVIPQTTRQLRIPVDNGDPRQCNIPFSLIGDPAYPLLPWLMKGYTQQRRLTTAELTFNSQMSRARVNVEVAFGRLKARWRVVSKKIDIHHTFVPDIVATCCVLHNMIESERIPINPILLVEAENDNQSYPQPNQNGNHRRDDLLASNMRDFLRDYIT